MLIIELAHMPEPHWNEQKEAVKATGADWGSKTKRWFLDINLDNPPIDTINTLFTIARKYGTYVRLVPEKTMSAESEHS